MNKDLIAIFEYLEKEKGIKRELIVDVLKEALKMAARKNVKGLGENITVEIHPKTGEIEVFSQKKIVDQVTDPANEVSFQEARLLEPSCEIGQCLEIAIPPQEFGRIAAQAARQIIAQKLRGAERDVIYEEYRHRVGELISGTVKRFIRDRTLVVDLGKVEAILPDRNYPKLETYQIGEKVHALLLEVRDTENGGAEVILTRSHPEFVMQLFTQEVPELHDKVVVIEKIARDPGYRTKMAVRSHEPKVDPVGTCVGVRGTRIKNVIRELNNEKIDVVPYSEDSFELLQNLLAPTQIRKCRMKDGRIFLVVADEDYPAVIGKRGMNARLIGRILECAIDVQKISEYQKILAVRMVELGDSPNVSLDEPLRVEGVSPLILQGLIGAGYLTLRQFMHADPAEISQKVPGVNYYDLADKIADQLKN